MSGPRRHRRRARWRELRKMNDLVLRHGLAFEDLYRRDGLAKLDAAFIAHLQVADVALHNRLVTARRDPAALERKGESDLLVDLAPHLEDFIADLFGIAPEMRALQARHDALAPIYTVKRLFVQRRAVKGVTPEAAAAIDGEDLARELESLFGEPLSEASYARHVARWLDAEPANAPALELAARYAAWATLAPEGRRKHRRGVLFKIPHKLDMKQLEACIYQKQEPVELPQVETRTLKDVPGLPWGFEIYSLLTRWNPLDIRRPLPKPASGYKVLVVGLGPAGFTLAHHLMNDGHTVVGVDGLKIEPLPQDVAGVGRHGERRPIRPVRDVKDLTEALDDS